MSLEKRAVGKVTSWTIRGCFIFYLTEGDSVMRGDMGRCAQADIVQNMIKT